MGGQDNNRIREVTREDLGPVSNGTGGGKKERRNLGDTTEISCLRQSSCGWFVDQISSPLSHRIGT